jgi:hypothetical protein
MIQRDEAVEYGATLLSGSPSLQVPIQVVRASHDV